MTPKLWPSSLCLSRSLWLSTEHWESTLQGAGFPSKARPSPSATILLALNSTRLSVLSPVSIRRPYITFKLPRGDMDTPPRLLPISGGWDVSLPLSLEWPVWSSSSGNNCHPVQRSLSSGASLYESIMGFFFTSSHFISQFPPTRFPLITATRMSHLLPVHYLEWHFWPGQQVQT